jgi:hypothetical protein
MASKAAVESFLQDFKYKLGFWGLLIRTERGKNFETIKQLEYSIEDVKKELRDLAIVNYAEGPLSDVLYKGADMWVFGKMVQSKEVYIKIALGQPGSKVICISFHFAEHAMMYPYK